MLDPHGNGAILLRQAQQRLRELRTLFEMEADAVFLNDNTGSIIELLAGPSSVLALAGKA